MSDSDSSSSSSDSEDEFFMFVGARGRRAPIVRPRVNHFTHWLDEEFFMRFRLTKGTVLHLLDQIEEELEFNTDRNHSLSPMDQLLLALRYYATGSMLITAGDFVGVHKCTAGRTIKRVTHVIAGLRERYIYFPRNEREIRELQLGFYNVCRFPRVIGAIDCTHIKIQSSGGNQAEDYRNRKNFFSINTQTISDHKLRIMDVVARWPGAAHDQTIFNNSRIKARLEIGEFGDGLILGDSGYALQPYLVVPLRNPRLPEEQLYNESQIRTRSIVERQYGTLKRRFPVLSLGIRLALNTVQELIVACAVLHNLAIDSKEPAPPVDPDLPELDIERDQMPRDLADPGVCGRGMQNALIEYFAQIL